VEVAARASVAEPLGDRGRGFRRRDQFPFDGAGRLPFAIDLLPGDHLDTGSLGVLGIVDHAELGPGPFEVERERLGRHRLPAPRGTDEQEVAMLIGGDAGDLDRLLLADDPFEGSVGMWMSSVVPTSSRAVGARWAPSLAGVVTVARESAREGNRFVAEPRGEGSATGGARLAGADRGPEVRLCKDADLLGHLPDGSESGRDDRPDPLLLGHIEEPLAHDPVEDDRLRGGRQVRERLDHVLYGGLADDDVALSDKEALRLVLDAVQ